MTSSTDILPFNRRPSKYTTQINMASYQECKPTWEHIEDVAQAPTSPTLSHEDKPMPLSPPVTISPSDEESQEDEVPQQFFVPAHLHTATSQRSPS